MSGMRDVSVDPNAKLARVGPGCTLGDVDQATQEHGLATTLGFVSATGVAGLTLGGGFGYLSRRFGWTVDDLEEVEIVTADGKVLQASRSENEDLFWAMRGGGGNFGVVTEFVFRLHEVGPQVTAGIIAWPARGRRRPGRLPAGRPSRPRASSPLSSCGATRLPRRGCQRTRTGSRSSRSSSATRATLEQAQADLAPIRAHGKPLADMIQVKDYIAQQSMLDATQPKGMNYYWKSEFVPGLSDELFEPTTRSSRTSRRRPTRSCCSRSAVRSTSIPRTTGRSATAMPRSPASSSRCGRRDSPAGDANRDWVRNAWQAIKPYSTGGNYINFQTADETDERTVESYRENYRACETVKAKYDPTNLFRVNRNIRP